MRHQPPVHSPIPLRALLGGVVRRGSRGAAHLRLTELLAREYDATGVVLCGSGTQALQLALRAALARVGRPCDVALPAFSCYDVAAAAVAVGRPLRFYDLDPGTLAPEPNSFDRVLRDGARIAVVSPLYGIPVPWDALEATAARHGAVLIEDAAQGHGAAWRGRPLGAMGEISVLSFGRGKGWTGGAGGAVLFRGDSGAEAAEFCRSLLGAHPGGGAHTAVVAQWALGRPRLYGIPASLPFLGLGETRYRDAAPPVPMDAAVAARILASRAAADEEAAARRRNAARYSGAVSGSITVPHDPAGESGAGFLRFPVRLSGGIDGFDDAREARRLGIAPSYPMPLPRLPAVRALALEPDARHVGAETLARDLITLPTHSRVTERARERILRLVKTREDRLQTGASPEVRSSNPLSVRPAGMFRRGSE